MASSKAFRVENAYVNLVIATGGKIFMMLSVVITKVYECLDMDKSERHVATTKHEENVTKVAANIMLV